MYKEVKRYVTADGKEFKVESSAREHALNLMRELIDKRLQALLDEGKLFAVDRYRVVMSLIPECKDDVEYVKMVTFITELEHILNY